ncbi:hypothetical protein HMPREF3038_00630 [Akkermansia sp. KLE1797]|nr:hypothetical protein HMPREF3038_00630 [Akkermansia sp. KLE1797]KXU54287.1 hypothetical protein HMPREF3039_01616 [Akkermansia sp. KLE1798]KZA04641.1 hypothetical protein HMPREF1326_01696 [Akkermansia sp. KLE1605]
MCHRSRTDGSLDSPDLLHLFIRVGKYEAFRFRRLFQNIAACAFLS